MIVKTSQVRPCETYRSFLSFRLQANRAAPSVGGEHFVMFLRLSPRRDDFCDIAGCRWIPTCTCWLDASACVRVCPQARLSPRVEKRDTAAQQSKVRVSCSIRERRRLLGMFYTR